MNIVVISDSHGRESLIDDVIDRQLTPPSALIFLGDGLRDLSMCKKLGGIKVYSVAGNCDWQMLFCDFSSDEEEIINIGGVRIMMTHGHKYGVKSGLDRIIRAAYDKQADLLLFGHTHEKLEMHISPGEMLMGGIVAEREIHIMNPGSLGFGRCWGNIEIDKKGQVLLSHGEL